MVTKTSFIIFPLRLSLLGKTTLYDQNYCSWRNVCKICLLNPGRIFLEWLCYRSVLTSLLDQVSPKARHRCCKTCATDSCSGYRLTCLHR